MKTRIAIVIAIVVLLLAGSAVFAQSIRRGTANVVEEEASCGVDNNTNGVAWRVSGSASGGGYQLAPTLDSTSSAASGCCCNYLPLIQK